jgi:hypothetical protein
VSSWHTAAKRRLALFALVILEQLHALEGSTAGNDFVGELGLVVIATVAIDLLVVVLSAI